MTRKDYKAIAEILRASLLDSKTSAERERIYSIERGISTHIALDNKRFNIKLFRDAIYKGVNHEN